MLLYLTIALFALAAVFGVLILMKWLSKKDTPRTVVYAHGGLAAAGLVLLLVYAWQNPESYPQLSIILFVVAAIGGFYMFFKDLQGKYSPLAVALIHALIAVAGFVALLIFALT